MTLSCDVAIIGAGPAGLSAAKAAADAGLQCTILDDQPQSGGQIYRAVGRANNQISKKLFGADYLRGRALLECLNHNLINVINEASVWDITPERQVYYSKYDVAAVIDARHIIIATGAMERPMPFPGWQLPGVLTAGAGQILLKASSVLPATPTVLAGSGPLLFLLAAQYLRAGHELSAIVETTPASNKWSAVRHVTGVLNNSSYLRKGVALLREIKQHGVRHLKHATQLRALGDSHVTSVQCHTGVKTHNIDCQTLLIHMGVVPNVQLTRMLDIQHTWNALQRCWFPQLGANGETAIEHISVAGDGGGIAGAEAAAQTGFITGIAAAASLGAISDEEQQRLTHKKRAALNKDLAARPFLDVLYRPQPEYLNPHDDTLVCRCEEVTAASIREYVDLGCLGPNQAKAYGRCGMGPCQGRFCGLTVSEIIAARRGVSVEEVGYYRIRPPIKPVTLGELASIDLGEDDSTVVKPL